MLNKYYTICNCYRKKQQISHCFYVRTTGGLSRINWGQINLGNPTPYKNNFHALCIFCVQPHNEMNTFHILLTQSLPFC